MYLHARCPEHLELPNNTIAAYDALLAGNTGKRLGALDQSRHGATCSGYRLRASLIELCDLVDDPDCCEWYFCPSLCCSEDRRSGAARTRVACGSYFRGHVTRALFGYTS